MEINKKTMRSLLFGALACIVAYWLLHETERMANLITQIKVIFSPFLLGAIMAFILNVPMRAIERGISGIKRLPLRRMLSMLLTLIALFLVIALVVGLIIPQLVTTVKSLVSELPGFFGRTEKFIREFMVNHPEITAFLEENTDLDKLDWASLVKNAATVAGNSVSAIFNGAVIAVGSVTDFFTNLIIAIVFSIYCLHRKEVLARQGKRLIYSFLPERVCDEIVRILRLANTTFSSFISGQCLEACILGAMFAVSMSIFRMPYVSLVSVLVAVTALVPMVGAFVGCVLGALFILVDNPMQAVSFVILFLILQQIEGNLIYPRVVGTSIGLPGMWVLLAVTVGGKLMGIGGMLLMIPVASVVYVLMREITEKRLARRQIPLDKLQDQPPELKSQQRKAKRQEKAQIKKAIKEENQKEKSEKK